MSATIGNSLQFTHKGITVDAARDIGTIPPEKWETLSDSGNSRHIDYGVFASTLDSQLGDGRHYNFEFRIDTFTGTVSLSNLTICEINAKDDLVPLLKYAGREAQALWDVVKDKITAERPRDKTDLSQLYISGEPGRG